MKILSIHWGLSHGGVATYAANIERLHDRLSVGLRSLCILPNGRDVDQDVLDSLDARVLRVSSVADLSWIWRVRAIIVDEKPDCVLTHGFNGHFASFLAMAGMHLPIRRLASYHGSYHPNTRSRRLVAPIYNGFTNWYLQHKADAIVSVAQFCVDALVESGVPINKFTVVHNGIPNFIPEHDKRTIIRHEWGMDSDNVIIGIASRLEKIKGLDYLLEAFASASSDNNKLRLVLIGEGTQKGALQKLAGSLSIDSIVKFVGIRNDIPDCLSAMDIFALPSLSEAHSIGLLEAMRARKAVVATDVGGNTESVRNEREGLIIKSADVNELTEALHRLANDAELRDRLGAAAYERFCSEFTEDVMLTKTANWLQSTCCR